MNIPPADNRFFQLPFRFDPEKLLSDLAVCEQEHWKAHFNTQDYNGEWNGIALRSATGSPTDIHTIAPVSFSDTPLLSRCPYFREILDQWKCEIESVRLLALTPGSSIKEHRDPGLGYDEGRFRLHIPILTDPNVLFIVDGCHLTMETGQCWYANFSLPHSVEHRGSRRRIHLVIDGVRNEWTDRWFAKAGYDFETERRSKAFDPATKSAMIRQLLGMDSDAARAILATLQKDPEVPEETLMSDPDISTYAQDSNWIPVALENTSGEPVVKWLNAGDAPFSEPFFHQTLGRIKRLEINKRQPNITSTLPQLLERAQTLDGITPNAIIFHTSRCGSTLLAQMLGAAQQNIVLSEVPLLDAILRLPFKGQSPATDLTEQAFSAALTLLGHSRKSNQQNVIVKTDSWHIFFYATLRKLYPQTPFLLMYRRPEEILTSHQKQRGLPSIPGYLESSFTGLHTDPAAYADLDGFLIRFLNEVFTRFIDIKSQDPNTFLINYNQGPEAMLDIFAQHTGLNISVEDRVTMMTRTRFDAKRPTEAYSADTTSFAAPAALDALSKLYDQLENM